MDPWTTTFKFYLLFPLGNVVHLTSPLFWTVSLWECYWSFLFLIKPNFLQICALEPCELQPLESSWGENFPLLFFEGAGLRLVIITWDRTFPLARDVTIRPSLSTRSSMLWDFTMSSQELTEMTMWTSGGMKFFQVGRNPRKLDGICCYIYHLLGLTLGCPDSIYVWIEASAGNTE